MPDDSGHRDRRRTTAGTISVDGADAQMEALAAALADRYELVRELGHGGMATVYLANDVRHHRQVAVKVMRPEVSAAVTSRHFLREIEVAARLQHPHIVPLFDSGEAGSRLFYVMAFEDGESLRERLEREQQLPLQDTLRIAREIADALAYAHSHFVIHRDVKPANILLANGHALLADFGIARTLHVAGEQLITTGMVMGTPAYMSPEQLLGERELDGRSDIFSLGCVIHEMLVGRAPFTGSSPQALLASQLGSTRHAVRALRPSVPEELEDVVDRALEQLPADRFDSAAELRSALEDVEITTTIPRPTQRWRRRATAGDVRRRWWRWAAVVAVTAAVVVGAWASRAARAPVLDPHRVVIFPLHEQSAPASIREAAMGESVARWLGYALEGAAPMRWLDASDHLADVDDGRPVRLTTSAERTLGRSLGAAYMIDGSIEPRGDSMVTVILRLRSVAGDSTITRSGADGAATPAAIPQTALRALRALLPSLVAPGQRVDLQALAERDPVAIVDFLRAERAYRDARFGDALHWYVSAVARDSAFAVAALEGAQAASWLNEHDEASRLAELALRHVELLPPRYAILARGLRHYLRGEADSSYAEVRRLAAADPPWADAWFLMGEIANHLLPSQVTGDSLEFLADSAFRVVRGMDPNFTPATQHLVEIALRRGEMARVDSLLPYLRPTLDDSSARWLDAIVRCVRDGPAAVDWGAVRGAGLSGGWDWGQTILFSAERGGCSRSAFRVTLASPDAESYARWGALMGSFASLVAAGRTAEALSLARSPEAAGLPVGLLLVPMAVAGSAATGSATGSATAAAASATMAESRVRPSSLSGPQLWMLATWYSARGDSARLGKVRDVLAARRDSTHERLDSLLASIADAHLAAARHDTTLAIERLRALTPRALYTDLTWQPWEGLAGERLLLARLLEARGEHAAAIAAATAIDAPTPIVNLSYLRPSLELRERAARALGDRAAGERYHRRLVRLDSDRTPYP